MVCSVFNTYSALLGVVAGPPASMATRSQKPKRKRDNNSPPKRKPKNVKNSEADCLICDEAILEPGDLTDGDDAVFC